MIAAKRFMPPGEESPNTKKGGEPVNNRAFAVSKRRQVQQKINQPVEGDG